MAHDAEVKEAIDRIKSKKLTMLDLSNKEFSKDVTITLFKCLVAGNKLVELDASRSSIRAHHLLQLPQDTCLRKLTLTGCILGNDEEDDKDMKKFAEKLKDDVCLTHLHISSALISESCAIAFIEALQKNKTLQHLDISGLFNPTKKLDVSDNIMNALVEMLMINKTLRGIELRFLKLKEDDKKRLKRAIQKRDVNLNIWFDDGENVLELKTDNKRRSVSLGASPLVTFRSESSLPKEDSSRTRSTESSPKMASPPQGSPRTPTQ